MLINVRAMKRQNIWKGMDHRLFFTILRDTLTQGPRHVSATTQRQEWLSRNSHHFSEALLVTYFAYIDGALGSKWIEKYGKKQKRELYVLRIVRNAIVHYQGNLKLLNKPKNPDASKGKPRDPCKHLRAFVRDVKAGKLLYDNGDKILNYLDIDRKGIVKLNSAANARLSGLATVIMSRAGLIKSNT